jgi:hypothetical protein
MKAQNTLLKMIGQAGGEKGITPQFRYKHNLDISLKGKSLEGRVPRPETGEIMPPNGAPSK